MNEQDLWAILGTPFIDAGSAILQLVSATVLSSLVELEPTGVWTSRAPGKVSGWYISFSSSSRRCEPEGKTLSGLSRTFGLEGQPTARPRKRAARVATAVVVTTRAVEG